jgi:hypothetical protein
MPQFKTPLQRWTLLLRAEDAARVFHVSYEVIAPDVEEAARYALADLAARGEKALDVEHAEAAEIANPLAQPGVRFRTGRSFFE